MSCDYSGLLPLLKTKPQVSGLRSGVSELNNEAFKTEGKQIEKIIHENIDETYAVIMYGQNISNDNIADHVREITRLIDNMREIKITVAFVPKGSVIDNISRWVKNNLGQDVYIDFIFEPKIIGGAVVSWLGKYEDYSVVKKWDEMWKDKQKFLLEKAGL